jgi:hypothetical protein
MLPERIQVDLALITGAADLLVKLHASDAVRAAIGPQSSEAVATAANRLNAAAIRGAANAPEGRGRALPSELPFQPREAAVLAALYLFPNISALEVTRRCEFVAEPSPLVQATNTLDELHRRNLVIRVGLNEWALHPVIASVLELGRFVQVRGLEGLRRYMAAGVES